MFEGAVLGYSDLWLVPLEGITCTHQFDNRYIKLNKVQHTFMYDPVLIQYNKVRHQKSRSQ